ncbi:MAG: septum formation inhibitor Maf [Oleiphilaceae bacterium]|nr:septum formation inhibitor Maf [Oleiphilaceae bacterium]
MLEKPLVLASSSPYRRALLARLGLPFTTASPDIDETPNPGESSEGLAQRLAVGKARALSESYPDHWIIGSDQVAELPDGSRLAKPGTYPRAYQQLVKSSGQRVTFHTGLALIDTSTARIESLSEPFYVSFRNLTEIEIEHYLKTETPYDCAGSFKMEGLGIALFTEFSGRDPNCLVGLPLIALNDLFRAWGLNPLTVTPS